MNSLVFKKYLSNNIEILVGINAKNNDILTCNYIDSNYWWAHIKDSSGPHIVIKHEDEIPHKTIIDICLLSGGNNYKEKYISITLCRCSQIIKKHKFKNGKVEICGETKTFKINYTKNKEHILNVKEIVDTKIETTYNCEKCKLSFTDDKNLKRHQTRHITKN